jgi:hypothetical protein
MASVHLQDPRTMVAVAEGTPHLVERTPHDHTRMRVIGEALAAFDTPELTAYLAAEVNTAGFPLEAAFAQLDSKMEHDKVAAAHGEVITQFAQDGIGELENMLAQEAVVAQKAQGEVNETTPLPSDMSSQAIQTGISQLETHANAAHMASIYALIAAAQGNDSGRILAADKVTA